ncbi:hypothetical protein [Nocardioides sp.]|uniref:hypothetical protein n=1 Tax=Nocardioides sp. TaxID=35761 RepID=UPI002386406A|nr:hypothetical protein [Nocardioides sp.]MDE0778055.1 hypothetical protein [Nocardioides sp.]
MTRRRAVRRTAGVLAVGVGVWIATTILSLDPDPVAILLVTALAVGGFTLVEESVTGLRLEWVPRVSDDPLTRGRDSATFADLRLLESHQTARHPDDHLQRRLTVLADRALRAAHGVGLDSPEGRAHLGERVTGLLDGGARRLSPRDIDLCLRTIEEL